MPMELGDLLEESEQHDVEGLPGWEDHDTVSFLVTPRGMACITFDGGVGHGVIRYPDKTICEFHGMLPSVKTVAEGYLAKRPYTTSFDRVQGEDLYEDEPVRPVRPAPLVVNYTDPPRVKPAPRVWKNVDITDVGDD